MVFAAAYGARVCFHCQVVQPTALKNPLIGFVVLAIDFIKIVLIGIERVAIVHRELTPTNQSTSRPRFITFFGLDLIQIEWHLLPGIDETADDIRDYLFMSEAQKKVSLIFIFKS